MKHRGIPLFEERRQFRLKMTLLTVALALLVFGTFLGLTILVRQGPGTLRLYDPRDPKEMSEAAREIERASAYAEVRAYIEQAVARPDLKFVHFGDNEHDARGRYFQFRGDVRLEDRWGEMTQLHYVIQLNGSSETGWNVTELSLEDGLTVW